MIADPPHPTSFTTLVRRKHQLQTAIGRHLQLQDTLRGIASRALAESHRPGAGPDESELGKTKRAELAAKIQSATAAIAVIEVQWLPPLRARLAATEHELRHPAGEKATLRQIARSIAARTTRRRTTRAIVETAVIATVGTATALAAPLYVACRVPQIVYARRRRSLAP